MCTLSSKSTSVTNELSISNPSIWHDSSHDRRPPWISFCVPSTPGTGGLRCGCLLIRCVVFDSRECLIRYNLVEPPTVASDLAPRVFIEGPPLLTDSLPGYSQKSHFPVLVTRYDWLVVPDTYDSGFEWALTRKWVENVILIKSGRFQILRNSPWVRNCLLDHKVEVVTCHHTGVCSRTRVGVDVLHYYCDSYNSIVLLGYFILPIGGFQVWRRERDFVTENKNT